MIEALKEKIKDSFKEIKEKTSKNLDIINKSLKESQENQEKVIREVKETV